MLHPLAVLHLLAVLHPLAVLFLDAVLVGPVEALASGLDVEVVGRLLAAGHGLAALASQDVEVGAVAVLGGAVERHHEARLGSWAWPSPRERGAAEELGDRGPRLRDRR